MTMLDKQAREERRRAQREGVEALEASGALEDVYAMIDAGRVRLDGKDGLMQQLITVGFERGLQAELTGHLGYEKGDAEAALHPNSRNGTSAKTIATSVGDVELAVLRDRDGSFALPWCPRGRAGSGPGRHDRVAVRGRDDRA